MEYRQLGQTALEVSEIGLGTWSMGGRWWGAMDDHAATATIHKALDVGINLIDTADVYGFGHCEELLARALGSRRNEVVIAAKVGLRWNNKGKVRNDLSPQHIEKAIGTTLERLNTDYIDIYQIHWPDPCTPVERTMSALLKLQKEGKIRYLGASNSSPEQMELFRQYGDVITLQPPLNLFERSSEVEILPYCIQRGIGVMTYSALCRGLLSGKFQPDYIPVESIRKRDPLFNGTVFQRNMRILAKLVELAAYDGRTVAQLSLAWVLAHTGVHVALCGARKPDQIAESAGAAGWQLSSQLLGEIDSILHCTA